jgi:mRNA interferase RelE/StbE
VHYAIRIKESAARELQRIERSDRERLIAAIDRLAENPFAGSALKGELRGLRRIRVGDYRLIYEVWEQDLLVLVLRAAHRREAYRRRTR